jgi:hypothetical protein
VSGSYCVCDSFESVAENASSILSWWYRQPLYITLAVCWARLNAPCWLAKWQVLVALKRAVSSLNLKGPFCCMYWTSWRRLVGGSHTINPKLVKNELRMWHQSQNHTAYRNSRTEATSHFTKRRFTQGTQMLTDRPTHTQGFVRSYSSFNCISLPNNIETITVLSD